MKILHRISFGNIQGSNDIFSDFNISTVFGVNTVIVDESHSRWEAIHNWIKFNNAVDSISTQFTENEVRQADWLRMVPEWHHGYPQPKENENGYLNATYNIENYCKLCGSSKSQNASFRMKSEPKWGNKSIMQLNWIYDEYFSKIDVFDNLFGNFGIEHMDVLGPRGAVLKTVTQLCVRDTIDIVDDSLSFNVCPACGVKKHMPHVRGFLPDIQSVPRGHIARSTNVFGDGASCYNWIVVSRELAQKILKCKLRGVALHPLGRIDI